MFKEIIKINNQEYTILYDEYGEYLNIEDSQFKFKWNYQTRIENTCFGLEETEIGKTLDMVSILKVGDMVSTSKCYIIMPLYNNTHEVVFQLAKKHLEKHILTLELVYSQTLNRDKLMKQLKEEVEKFYYPG